MSFEIATFTAAGQSTQDFGNRTTFREGIVQVVARNLGGFVGTVQLRRAYPRSNGAYSPFEVVDAWDETKLPLTREFSYVPGVRFDMYCSACAAGSVEVGMGREP